MGRTAYVAFKSISFCVAVANSYALNSRWVFKRQKARRTRREGALFFVASCIGFLLNIGASVAVFSLVGAIWPDFSKTWSANIGAVAGVVATNVWNYLSYKFFVFKAVRADERMPLKDPSFDLDASA